MIQHKDLDDPQTREAIIVVGGIAGLSAAIYLGRRQRDTLVIDSGRSMAKWEPVVENYLVFARCNWQMKKQSPRECRAFRAEEGTENNGTRTIS